MDDDRKYTIQRNRNQVCIYDPDGNKIAEVWGGAKEWENAKLIVNGLNMRHRWLIKKEKENN